MNDVLIVERLSVSKGRCLNLARLMVYAKSVSTRNLQSSTKEVLNV